jgi:hypothetical protein
MEPSTSGDEPRRSQGSPSVLNYGMKTRNTAESGIAAGQERLDRCDAKLI